MQLLLKGLENIRALELFMNLNSLELIKLETITPYNDYHAWRIFRKQGSMS